jgi:heptosyltransferase-2
MKQHRILIIRPDRVGDVVLTTPLIREIKKKYPESFVGVLVSPATRPLLEQNPNIDVLLTDDPQGADSGNKGFWKQVRILRSFHFTTGLMPLPRERHAWMMFCAGIPKRIGVGTKLYQVLTGMKSVSRHKYIPLRHEADYVMDLGRKIGVKSSALSPELFLTEGEISSARSALAGHGFDISKPVIGINPGSNKSSANWDIEQYKSLIRSLSPSSQIFLNVGPKNSGLREHFTEFNNAFLFDSDSLRELIAMVNELNVLVTSSTGPLHIASALKIPTISIFCPLTACSPTLWGPLGNKSYVFLPPEGYCQGRCPGNPKICPLEEIPIDPIVHHIESIVHRSR